MSPDESIRFHQLPAVRWRASDGATAIVTLQGAQLVSWVPPGGRERLYVSERSAFEPGRAIRGGVPICFPQFADRGPLPQHGFARTQAWRFLGAEESSRGATATFALESSAQTLALWPCPFRIELRATIGGARLELELRIENPGSTDFTVTTALHTYLRLASDATAELLGLQGVRYVNRGQSAVEAEPRERIPARDTIDRVYLATPSETRLEMGARTLLIEQRGFPDTVVWNPGPERTVQMADMRPEGYRDMLCVEAAAVQPAVTVAAGAVWSGAQVLTAQR
jgi:glucose-6-phosphate 1-epimerase